MGGINELKLMYLILKKKVHKIIKPILKIRGVQFRSFFLCSCCIVPDFFYSCQILWCSSNKDEYWRLTLSKLELSIVTYVFSKHTSY